MKALSPLFPGRPAAAPASVALLFLLIPHPALAQAMTLGEVMCNAASNVTPFAWLMNGIAYILGAIFIGAGLVYFVKYHDNPRENRLHTPIMHVLAGACLLALPSFISLVLNSIFNFSGGGGLTVCSGNIPAIGGVSWGSWGSYGSGVGLDVLMTNLVLNIKDPMTFMLSAISITMGVFLIIRGLVKASRYGLDPRGNPASHILASILIGAVLFVVGQSLGVMMSTLFGSSYVGGYYDVMGWSNLTDNFGVNTVPFQNAVYAALTFFQLIGFIAFIRGWIVLKNAVEGHGQATVAQGITHILGGVAAVNIYYVLVIFDTTFGTGFLS